MGLDMNLYKKRYVRNWPHRAHQFDVRVDGELIERAVYVDEELAYWRKANHIHNYFIEATNSDWDERDIYVSPACLTELRDRCAQVLSHELVDGVVNNGYQIESDGNGGFNKTPIKVEGKVLEGRGKAAAERLLPTTEGFFFGSTDYDQYYIEQVAYTKETLDELFSQDDWQEHEYVYHACW